MQSNFIKSHIIDLIFVIIFLFCLCIPNLHLSPAEKSEEENRMLAKYVPLTYDKKINWNYGSDFEKFYNDRFYCRRKLIKLNTLLKKENLPTITGKEVMKGKDGWLFYRGNSSELNFLNYNMFTEEQLAYGLKYLTDIKDWCDSNGKFFVFLICPDKNKIYGEYYPDGYKKVRPDTESRAFQFVNYIRANSDISVIYPYNELIAKKASGRLLYYKGDTHWNFCGAYIAYKLLMNELEIKLPISQLDTEEFKETDYKENDLVKIFFHDEKTIQNYDPIYFMPNIQSEYNDVIGDVAHQTLGHKTYETICNNKNYNAAFFRDSFTRAMSIYISNTFNHVMYYWRYGIIAEDLAYIKDNIDVVVLECVERYLPNAILNTFPQIDLNGSEATK